MAGLVPAIAVCTGEARRAVASCDSKACKHAVSPENYGW